MMHNYTPQELAPLKIPTSSGYRSVHTSPAQTFVSPMRPRKDSADSVDDVIAAIDNILISTSSSPHSPRSPKLDKPLPPRKMQHASTFPLTIRKRRTSREDVHILRSTSCTPPLTISIPKPRTSQISKANIEELNTLHAPMAPRDLASSAASPMSCITDSDNCFSDLSSSAAASPQLKRPTSAPTPRTPGLGIMPRSVSQITSCRIESVAMLDFPEFMPWGGEEEEEDVLSPALEIDEGDWYVGVREPELPVPVESEKEWVGEECAAPPPQQDKTTNREWERTTPYGGSGSDRIISPSYPLSERIASPPPQQHQYERIASPPPQQQQQQYGRSSSPQTYRVPTPPQHYRVPTPPLSLPRQSQQPLYPSRDDSQQPLYPPPRQSAHRAPSPFGMAPAPPAQSHTRALRSPSPPQGYAENVRTLRSPSPPQVQIHPTDALKIMRADWVPGDDDRPPPPPPKEDWREREREMKMDAEFLGVSESRFSMFSVDEERKRNRSRGRWLGLKKR